MESASAEVLPGQVPAREVVASEVNAREVARLVAGGRVELRRGEAKIGGILKRRDGLPRW